MTTRYRWKEEIEEMTLSLVHARGRGREGGRGWGGRGRDVSVRTVAHAVETRRHAYVFDTHTRKTLPRSTAKQPEEMGLG